MKFLLTLALLLTSCFSIKTSITIDAPANTVWAILQDTSAYPEWNSFLRIDGKLATDETVHITVMPPQEKPMSFSPSVLHNTPYDLMWRGRVLMPGLFTGEHNFRVDVKSQSQSVFHQDEDFSGILVPFISLKNSETGFKKMNEELKARAENFERAKH